MIVFKTYLKILKKNIFIIMLYTLFLIFFTGFNMESSDNNLVYEDVKPDILIINNDEYEGITKNLILYLEKNSNRVKIENDPNKINDALFYRDVSYIIYIPKNFRNDFLNGLNPEIEVKSVGDYEANLTNLYLEKYLNYLNKYKVFEDENIIISKLNEVLDTNISVNITSKLNKNALNKAAFYYNFLNYSMLATSLYVIGLVLSSFNFEKVKKRMIVSSMSQVKINRLLFISNTLFILSLWLIYVLLSFILLGNIMFTEHGLILIINSFLFSIVCQMLSFLISNLINNKETTNLLANVISLGTSFLCGAFVPMSFLPNVVLKFSHILPSYYYILTNELLKNLEVINLDTIKPIIINMVVLIIFIVLLIVINNYISKKKMKIA